MHEPGQGDQDIGRIGGQRVTLLRGYVLHGCPVTFSNEFAMLDIPSPAEMRRNLFSSLSNEVAAALLWRLRPAAERLVCTSGMLTS